MKIIHSFFIYLAVLAAGLLSAPVAHSAPLEFPSAGGITINNLIYTGPGDPYPSSVTVTGAEVVSAVRVKINGFTSQIPGDVDIFLVAPNGQVSAVFSDVGGISNPISNVNLVIDDAATAVLPVNSTLVSGTYLPINNEPGEAVPEGATGPIGNNLSALAANGANGVWKLFVTGDGGADNGGGGTIASWALVIESNPPAPPPATLEIATYAGLTITATETGFWDIEATSDLSQAGGWALLDSMFYVQAGEPSLWVDTSAPVAGKRFYRAVESPARPVLNMIAISSGTFVMGSPATEVGHSAVEWPQTQVALTKGFYMGKYEVTQSEYLAVMGTNPSHFTGDMNRPVEQVSWNDAVAYCAALTTTERSAGRCPADWSYRLPTEAEWEYACRAGTTTRFSYGDDPGYTLLGNYAWYSSNAGLNTHPVGQKAPNPWGLYDMHGNVWEWCQDSWDGSANYPGGSTIDPLVTTGSDGVTSGSIVLRGGCWSHHAGDARCAFRFRDVPFSAFFTNGFRAVLAPGE